MQSLLSKDTILRTYVRQYNDKEGIHLDYHSIKKNPSLRSLAKLMLNLFWGKMGQRYNLTWTTYIDDPKQFMDMITSVSNLTEEIITAKTVTSFKTLLDKHLVNERFDTFEIY